MYVGRNFLPELEPESGTDNKMTYSNEAECLAMDGGRIAASTQRLGQVVRVEDAQEMDNAENMGDGNHEGGFGYSQKFFHISDGNLYSVFSPLQGRSYGVKPSFLRKHRCTVQETKGKKGGKRNARRGLKFHNFIPSESITSERDEGQRSGAKDNNRSKSGSATEGNQGTSGEVWKVHAECRLREEHGTKQIMVSNWSLSSDSPALPNTKSSTTTSASVKANTKDVTIVQKAPTQTDSPVASPNVTRSQEPRKDQKVTKPSVLQQYLEYGKMLDSDSSATSLDETVKQEMYGQEDCKKHRRKPTTTRRVVPYTKYLSMMDDAPLDLSCQKDANSIGFEENSFHQSLNLKSAPIELPETNLETLSNWSSYSLRGNKNTAQSNAISHKASPFNGPTLNPGVFLPPRTTGSLYPATGVKLEPNNSNQEDQISYPSTSSGSFVPNPANGDLPPGFMSLSAQQQNLKMITKHQDAVMGRPRRKPSQRTIIRQKLEDTFKQNGFLVKTKQVSDGDATFCKFKQLRKYTRYYLKSWHQHLPDEVHKLWKGFLPPKTPFNMPKTNSEAPQAKDAPPRSPPIQNKVNC